MYQKTIQDLLLLARDTPTFAGAKMAAVIKDKREIISFGFNQKKSHPLQKRYSSNPEAICLHSEIDAIRKAPYRTNLRGKTLFVARVLKGGQRALAKPCIGCQRAIKDFGFKEVVYSTPKGYKVIDYQVKT